MDRLVAHFERKAVTEAGTFEGFASTFGNVDLGGDIIARGAFTESLGEWQKRDELPALLFGHNMDEPIGEFTSMEENDRGLFVKGKLWINAGVPKADQAHKLLTSGGPKGMSIGFIPKDAERGPEGTRVIKNVELLETSIVVFGMNPEARITDAKGILEGREVVSRKQVERALRDALGLSASQAKSFCAEGIKGLRNAVLADETPSLDPDDIAALKTFAATITKKED